MSNSVRAITTQKYEKRLQTILFHISAPYNPPLLLCTPTSSNNAPPEIEIEIANDLDSVGPLTVDGVPVTSDNIDKFNVDFENLNANYSNTSRHLAMLGGTLKSLREALSSNDYEEGAVDQAVQLVFDIGDILMSWFGIPPISTAYYLSKRIFYLIRRYQKDPKKRRFVLSLMDRIVLAWETAISATIKILIEGNKLNVSTGIFYEKLNNKMKTPRNEAEKAMDSVGMTFVNLDTRAKEIIAKLKAVQKGELSAQPADNQNPSNSEESRECNPRK